MIRAKRTFDVVLSALGLIALGPLMLILAVLVKLDSPGPALFRHRRVGQALRGIEVLKFRSMTTRRRGPEITFGADSRITRIGGILRRFKLDELPQLWNVFRGDMSFVGPRPEVESYVALHRERYAFLLTARPGITDPASLAYRAESELLGKAKDPEQYYRDIVLPDKIRISSDYLRKANIWTDIGVLFQTVVACFRRGTRSLPLPLFEHNLFRNDQ